MLKTIASFRTFTARLSSFENVQKIKSTIVKQIVIEELKDREIVKVRGEEAVPFLQGLITNDMNHLVDARFSGYGVPSMFAMFLNKAGRVLYDAIIYRAREPSTFFIECDRHVSNELRRHLRIYRVRRAIDVESMEKTCKAWVIFDPESAVSERIITKSLGTDTIYAPDPRVRELGWRLLTASDRSWGDVARAFTVPGEVLVSPATSENNYRYNRYRLGVGEGIQDHPTGKCFPLEINGDFLHGVSFQKGCYIGQELTARVFHTGVVRKRLMSIKLTSIPDKLTNVQTEVCANVGTLRGICNDHALALLRVEQVLRASHLMVDGDPCHVEKPFWWPEVLPNKASIVEKA